MHLAEPSSYNAEDGADKEEFEFESKTISREGSVEN